jgi:uncharacterized protein (DUF1501 family)
MDRREFLKLMCASASIAASSSAISAMSTMKVWALSGPGESRDKQKLVVIFLRGGADGLNMVVPYGDDNYYKARSAIAIAKPGTANGAIDLDGHFGLHPSLEAVHKYWQNKTLSFFYAAGSPHPSRSHFDAQAHMETGVLGARSLNTGWMNRLAGLLPEDSLLKVLSVSNRPPRIVCGPNCVAQIETLENQARHLNLDIESFQKLYATDGGPEGRMFNQAVEARKQLQTALDGFMHNREAVEKKNKQETDLSFGQQLAYLFNHEPGMRIAFIDSDLWDTHTEESNMGQSLFLLARGLSDLAEGLGPQYEKTTIIVLSEFGRTVQDNGNGGTDHGHGNVIWAMGGGIPGGKVYGRFDNLAPKNLNEERDLPVTTDFRQIVGYLLNERMEIARPDLEKIFPDYSGYSDPFTIG